MPDRPEDDRLSPSAARRLNLDLGDRISDEERDRLSAEVRELGRRYSDCHCPAELPATPPRPGPLGRLVRWLACLVLPADDVE